MANLQCLETGKKEPAVMFADKPLPVSTFKTSLRVWQARWKAQQPVADPAQPAVARQVKARLKRSRLQGAPAA